MKEYGKYQKEVIEAARKELRKHIWYRGVSLDKVPSEEECQADVKACADQLVIETEYWDRNWQRRTRV
jgi:hypothetical protein